MKKLLIFETHKLLRQKSFYICLGVMVIVSFLNSLLQKIVIINMGDNEFFFGPVVEYNGVNAILSFLADSSFTLINAIFIVLLVCNDFTSETIKNIYARGFSKTKVFFSKLIMVGVATTVQFLVVLLFSIIFGLSFFGTGTFEGKYAFMIFAQWFACLAWAAFAFAVAYILKRTGVSIALTILAPVVVELILSLIEVIFKIYDAHISDYWVSSFTTVLAARTVEVKKIWICLVLSVVYGAAFVAGAWALDRKHDVK